jgi:uncharacterized membrane protein
LIALRSILLHGATITTIVSPAAFNIVCTFYELCPAFDVTRRRSSLDKMKVEQSVIINLPPEEIFAYLSNLENLADWSSVVIFARKISSEDMLIGTTVRCTFRILGRWLDTTFEIVECVPNRYLTIKSITGVAPSLICYRFEPVEGGGTNVSLEEIIYFLGGVLGFAEPVVTSIIRRQLAHDLLTLKDLLEAAASNCSSAG